ncbi:dihydroorotase [Candidatus Woesearchaeota archaeon]|nr:dihydroorotase [Candidatus Woesearchaeota archaeon]
MATIIRNGSIVTSVTPQGIVKQDILIKEGKIASIGRIENIEHQATAENVIDASGKYVLPGLIDVHVHFREPGQEHKEDWLTGSMAAAGGGVTTVLDMPNNKDPIITQELLDRKKEAAKKSIVNYGFYAGATPENAKTVSSLQGIVGVKAYLGSSTGSLLLGSLKDFAVLIEHATVPVVTHCENEQLLLYFGEKYAATEMHHVMRDNLCATVSTIQAALIAERLQKRLHIAHVSTKEEIGFLQHIKSFSSNVTFEITPHHLFLDKEYFIKNKNYGKMNPPLRSREDQQALWKAVKKSLVDCIATDHAPHTKEEKEKSFPSSPCGVPGVQTMLPLLLNEVNKGILSLQDIVRLCAENPARIFRLKNKGKIQEGYDADLVIIDMNVIKEIRDEDQYSKCGWTPFHGWTCKGWPVMTIVNGDIVMENGKIPAEHKEYKERYKGCNGRLVEANQWNQ